MSRVEVRLQEVMRDLTSLIVKMKLPARIVERTWKLYNEMVPTIKRRRSKHPRSLLNKIDGIASACLYIVCRMERTPRSIREICGASGVPMRHITRSYIAICRRRRDLNIQALAPHHFLERFCADLRLPSTVLTVSTQIATSAEALDVVAGRSPLSVAAASLYMAARRHRNQYEVAEVTGVSQSTICSLSKLLQPHCKQLIASSTDTADLNLLSDSPNP